MGFIQIKKYRLLLILLLLSHSAFATLLAPSSGRTSLNPGLTSSKLSKTLPLPDKEPENRVIACIAGISFSGKAILEGAYDSNTLFMDDYYRTDGLLPTMDPYGLNTSIDPSLLNLANQDNILDWVRIELRDATDPTLVIAEKAILLQRDGDLMDINGSTEISFPSVPSQPYFVVLKHYNHLGVMTGTALDMSTTSPHIDFTDPATPVYSLGGQALVNVNGVMVMWAGDANGDGKINAVDKNLFWIPQNGNPFIYGSTNADLNLNGVVNALDLNFYWRVSNSYIEQIPN